MKLMSKLLTTISLFTLFALQSAHAKGGGMDGGGGDEIGLEFRFYANHAIDTFREHPEIFGSVDTSKLKHLFAQTKIIVSDEELPHEESSVIQAGVATNYPDKNLIVVQRTRWSNMDNNQVREAIALHEILSLEGLESTGVYTYSDKYMGAASLPCVDDVCMAGENSKKGFHIYRLLLDAGIKPVTDGTVKTISIAKLSCEHRVYYDEKGKQVDSTYCGISRSHKKQLYLKDDSARALFDALDSQFRSESGDGHQQNVDFTDFQCEVESITKGADPIRAGCNGTIDAKVAF